MAFTFDAEQIKTALAERGFDASVEDGVVTGRLDEGAVREVWIDRGGTLRLQLTRMLDEGQTERTSRGERAYKVSRERQEIVNVWTDLASVDGLGDILDEAEDVARHPAKAADAKAAPAPAPVQPPASAPLPGEPGAPDVPPVPHAASHPAAPEPPAATGHSEASMDDAPPTSDESRPDDTPEHAPPSLAHTVAARVNQLMGRRTRRRK